MTTLVERGPAPTAPPARLADELAGTWLLLRFMLRRDRVRLGVWTASVVGLWLYVAVEFTAMYAEPAARAERATLMRTPASVLMTGPGYGLDDYTIGAMCANEMVLWIVICLSVMSILEVVRHTRAEEESSRSELVRAAVVGRHAPAFAAMALVVVANLVIAALSALVLVTVGHLAVFDTVVMVGGSALTVLVFAAVAVVACQLTAHARGASGLAVGVLGLMALVRGAGDMRREHGSALSWASPIAWTQQTRAFVDVRAWPLVLPVVAVVVLVVVAVVLAGHRDFGAGMFADRRGRASAHQALRSPLALAWRQQRTALAWWTLGTVLMWLATGTYVKDVGPVLEDMVAQNPVIGQVIGEKDMTDAYVSLIMLYAALAAVGYGISAVLRARAEEAAGRTEYVLAGPVGRGRWLSAQLVVAGAGAGALMVAEGLALGTGAYLVGAHDPSLGTYALAAVVYLPAVAVVLGVAAALLGWMPRWTGASWAFLVLAFVVGMFGDAFHLPDAVQHVSPLRWVPRVPVEDVSWLPVAGLCVVAAVLFAGAFAGFRRRDIPVV
ncbi:MAG: hypothetical protein FWF21_08235 [Micrococcales bacterium]|nr:hypothetical protein [Micrococcales bacterium]